MKQLLKRVVFGAGPLRAHAPVGLRDWSRVVRVTLEGLGAPLDVSADHVPAALRPFTIGVCLDPSVSAAVVRRSRPRLVLRDWEDKGTGEGNAEGGGRVRGWLALRARDSIDLGTRRLWLFEIVGSTNRCLALPHVYARELRDWWGRRKRNNPYNFRMTAADLRAINVYYMRPRPVSLVTVVDGDASNIFPMDLIGPVSSGQFLLALRTTSPAVALMAHVRRVAVSGIPASFKQVAYALGEHHRQRTIDWSTVPFATVPSPVFGLPVPRDALVVRELAIRDVHTIGSHTLFVTDIVRETPGADAPAFCHMAGPLAYQRHTASLP